MSSDENALVTLLRGRLTEYVARVEDLERQLHTAQVVQNQADWPVIATQRLRSVVSALGLQSEVPEGDLTGYEFAVLGAVRRAIERLQAMQRPDTLLSDIVKYTRLARGIQNPAGVYPNGPWEDFYACDDVERAISTQAAAPVVASQDPIVEMNVALLRQRSAVGVQKYGVTMAGSGLTLRQWLQHALEEGLDKVNYLQAAIQTLDASQPSPAPVAMTDEQIEQIVRDVTGDYESEYLESDRNFYRDLTRAILAAQQEAV